MKKPATSPRKPTIAARPVRATALAAVTGGAEVVTIPMGTNKLPIKSVSTLKFEEMTAEF